MKFKVVSSDSEGSASQSSDPGARISKMVEDSSVFLFMKGNPEAPQCGFSYRVVQVLNSWNVPFNSFNVLSDEGIRQGIKDFSNWPTIPQLYVNHEFVGGCDIIEELSGNGELADILKSAYPDREFTPPPPPAEVQEVSSIEASEILKNQPDISILDVRPPEERAKASLSNSQMLDNHIAQEIIDSWDMDTPMMLICHQGIRSRQAAQYFTSQGFQQVYNVSDGIDGWSQNVDSSIPRY
ncbi:MAG TPA: Grx4 family monothiol glutaredoxin [Deltaproteobacteria bacterium]|jgi:monothiol glutaredoxin|nr:monothiol glutaredoxin, Grx4 family [Deltaproteobacteria bacterium]HCP33347.1 Grx4 family monothiol glutaredoxin [Deltaproteobacteria bacterium]|tara:strand:+ start:1416 stop:2132 length:717 start_codon:yes stop_codon:yes gene_type:complete